MPHIVSSALVYGEVLATVDEAVWYADDRAVFSGIVLDTVALGLLGAALRFTDAVAIDNRERTRSKGYVEQTEVIPARAPLANLLGVSSSLDP